MFVDGIPLEVDGSSVNNLGNWSNDMSDLPDELPGNNKESTTEAITNKVLRKTNRKHTPNKPNELAKLHIKGQKNGVKLNERL